MSGAYRRGGTRRPGRAGPLTGDRLAAMTAWTARTASPFGRVLTAMVTPMHDDGSLDLAGLQKAGRPPRRHRARRGRRQRDHRRVRRRPPTTEQDQLLRAVLEVAGDRGRVVAGVGTQRHRATVHRREAGRGDRRARAAGRDPVLQPAHPGRARRALHRRRGRHRPAGDALRHPGPHRHADRHRDAAAPRRPPAHRRRQGRQGRPVVRDEGARPDRPAVVLRRRRRSTSPTSPRARRAIVGVVGHVAGAAVCRDGSPPSTRGDLRRRRRDPPARSSRSSTRS